jgi:predicted AAA+ superfamily ATPase
MYEKIVEAYHSKSPMAQPFHDMAMKMFYEYLLVGGMPEAVSTYLETGSLNESRKVLKVLYGNYLADMDLYQASSESIIRSRAIFSNICNFLNKESKNFTPSLVEKGTKTRDMRSPIDWLKEAHVIYTSQKVDGRVVFPITESEGPFRIYLSDMGMFSYQSGINPVSFITGDGRDSLSGIFYENFAAEELGSRGIPLFYWSGKAKAEFEFILNDNGFAIPLDVKRTKGSLSSLRKFREHNRFSYAVKVSRNNYGFDNDTGTLTIPFYELFLFADQITNDRIPDGIFSNVAPPEGMDTKSR